MIEIIIILWVFWVPDEAGTVHFVTVLWKWLFCVGCLKIQVWIILLVELTENKINIKISFPFNKENFVCTT